jgi:2-hydroxy-3-oxopropionate reductase
MIGFIGLGVMGKPMARNLMAAGHDLVVYSRTRADVDELAGEEARVLGSKAGVDPATIIQVLSGGVAANRVMEVRGRNFPEHDFEPGFRVDLHHKDLGIALSTAREYGVALPATAAVGETLQALRTRGAGDRDHSALLTLIEDLAQHTIGAPAGAAA